MIPRPDATPCLEPTSSTTVQSEGVSGVFSVADNCSPPSNNTSMISNDADDPWMNDLEDDFSTQDYRVDDGSGTSFQETPIPPSACVRDTAVSSPFNLTENTPFKEHVPLPSSVPFWCSWEVHRMAALLGDKPLDVYNQIERSCGPAKLSYDVFWSAAKQLCSARGVMLPKSNIPGWTISNNQYEDEQSNTTISLTATLDWDADPTQGVLTFRLNPISSDKSCRLHRRFGADRFLVMSVPDFSIVPQHQRNAHRKQDAEVWRSSMAEFLSGGCHYIAGRLWKPFFAEENKKKTRQKDSSMRYKIHMFAVDGYDYARVIPSTSINFPGPSLKVGDRHQAISLEAMLQWHTPIAANLTSTDLKLSSRWSLGLSKTTPTITLEQNEFLYLPDTFPVMNDGCALM